MMRGQSMHTPGPWRARQQGNHWRVVAESAAQPNAGLLIAKMSNERRPEVNAALIAAAPDLLEALETVEAVLSIVEPRSDKAEYLAALNKTRAAIAKAGA